MSPGGVRLSFGRVPDALFHGPLKFDYFDVITKVKTFCRKIKNIYQHLMLTDFFCLNETRAELKFQKIQNAEAREAVKKISSQAQSALKESSLLHNALQLERNRQSLPDIFSKIISQILYN